MKLSDIYIRTTFEPGDIGYITYMHGQFYQFGPLFEVYVAETLSAFYKSFDHSKERIWIAEHNGKIVGTIALKNTDNQAQLRYFLLDPAYRGFGLGKRLMDLLMEFMKSSGYKRSFLLTEEKLETAAHLYGRYGYVWASSRKTEMGLIEQRYEMTILKTKS